MMKRLTMILLVLVLLMPALALGEVHIIENESELPEGWSDKELLRLTAIDTDRSDAMLLQCGGENMMIDGGSVQYYPRLEEYFDAHGVTEFKYLFNTHYDNDHIQGLTKTMNSGKYTVGGFYSAVREDFKDKGKYHSTAVRVAKNNNIPFVQIYHGDVLTLGGATINVLRCDEPWGTNARSACTQIVFGESKVLLTGDIDSRPQKWFVQNCDPSLLDCDILKAPHHGINGFEDSFLEATTPESVFVCNYSSHASIKSGWKRYFESKGGLFAGDGTVIMETDGTDWYIWQLPNWKKSK